MLVFGYLVGGFLFVILGVWVDLCWLVWVVPLLGLLILLFIGFVVVGVMCITRFGWCCIDLFFWFWL